MPTDVTEAKRALRAEVRGRRRLLSETQRDAAAEALVAQLDALVARLGARSISCFLSTGTEPGTREFVRGAVRRGIRVLLPITRTDGLLDWAVADDTGAVAEGLFGLPEPTGEVLGAGALDDVELMIVPAAAVDRHGVRLGWGRGYFDRTIAALPECPPVYAVIYDSEVLESLPRELHDQPVTGAVTPTRILTLSPQRR